MKYMLLFPPSWPPFSPYLSVPTLLGHLKKEGYNAEAIDLNVEFYNDVLKKSYLEKTVKNLKKIQADVSKEAEKYDVKNSKIEDYPVEIQEILLKDKEIREFSEKYSDYLKIIPKQVEKALANLKDPKHFYDPESFVSSFGTVHLALRIASLPYAPTKIIFYGYRNPLLKFNYESIKHNVFSKSTNIFIDYYKKWLPIIKKKKPQYIGISITTGDQVIAGLTLANLLKKHTNAHINIGGNFFSRIYDNVVKHPEFFDLFADSISVYEGEKPIIELAKYIDNKIPIEEVPNLIYKKNNEIIINKQTAALSLNETAIPSYDGFNFSKYLTKDIVLPIQITRGCYWGKCTFCDLPYGKQYNEKSIDNLINELKEYKKKFGITNFCIVDESIHPKYLEKMAEKIIENNLNINYYCTARTEKEFTSEILKKARKSGLRMISWGVESGSSRIMKLINKGIDIDNRIKLLQESSDADIWNHAFTFLGFPSETLDEAKETIEMVAKNSNIINSFGMVDFKLAKHSKIHQNLEEYGLKVTDSEEREFSNLLNFEMTETNKQKMAVTRRLQNEFDQKEYGRALWKYCNCYHYIFLYISHHGVEWVNNYKIDTEENKPQN